MEFTIQDLLEAIFDRTICPLSHSRTTHGRGWSAGPFKLSPAHLPARGAPPPSRAEHGDGSTRKSGRSRPPRHPRSDGRRADERLGGDLGTRKHVGEQEERSVFFIIKNHLCILIIVSFW